MNLKTIVALGVGKSINFIMYDDYISSYDWWNKEETLLGIKGKPILVRKHNYPWYLKNKIK